VIPGGFLLKIKLIRYNNPLPNPINKQDVQVTHLNPNETKVSYFSRGLTFRDTTFIAKPGTGDSGTNCRR